MGQQAVLHAKERGDPAADRAPAIALDQNDVGDAGAAIALGDDMVGYKAFDMLADDQSSESAADGGPAAAAADRGKNR